MNEIWQKEHAVYEHLFEVVFILNSNKHYGLDFGASLGSSIPSTIPWSTRVTGPSTAAYQFGAFFLSTSLMAPDGHMETQRPQPKHLVSSHFFSPSTMLRAPNTHRFPHSPQSTHLDSSSSAPSLEVRTG